MNDQEKAVYEMLFKLRKRFVFHQNSEEKEMNRSSDKSHKERKKAMINAYVIAERIIVNEMTIIESAAMKRSLNSADYLMNGDSE